MRSVLTLRVGAWYGDQDLAIEIPPRWDVEVLAPSTPPPIGGGDIENALMRPVGAPPLRDLARGRRRPLIIVDDLTRPTPTHVVMPYILRALADAGISNHDVRILVACGMHGRTPRDAAAKKAGGEASASCRLIVHDPDDPGVAMGRTTFGTPIMADREIADSDLVIGIGGVYPQHSVGFGGGSKLVLGVLAKRSIVGLHYGHSSVAGTYDTDNDFRRDLDEIADRVGLNFMVTMHVDARRQPVRVVAGDPRATFPAAVEFSRSTFSVGMPGSEHDVVVANAYPMDVSLTFARSKGLAPLARVNPGASRVFVAACPEGLGLHRLFPYLNGPRYESMVHRLRRWSVVRPSAIPNRAVAKVRRKLGRLSSPQAPAPTAAHRPRQEFAGQVAGTGELHLWTPMAPPGSLPNVIPGVRNAESWAEIVARVEAEHPGMQRLKVAVYPCAPLQVLRAATARAAIEAAAC